MKAELVEWDDSFDVELEAETLEEAALVTRFGINSKKELLSLYAAVLDKGPFTANITFRKRIRACGRIPKAR